MAALIDDIKHVAVAIENTFILIPLERIVSKLPVRKLSSTGMKRIQESIQRSGYLDNYPLVVVSLGGDTYQLVDGNHRYEAAKAMGIASVPCVVKDEMPESELYRLALQSNNAAETVVPSTLVTYAEFIWSQSEKYTLFDIGKMLGWNEGKTKQYSALSAINKYAWHVIVTTFEKFGNPLPEEVVTKEVTTVTFTERLLRSILQLRAPQQYELTFLFAHPNEKERISKGKFNTLAESYRVRNDTKRHVIKEIGSLGLPFVRKAFIEIDKGIYDKDWMDTKDHPKLMKLIESLYDEWEKKHSVHLINGDFYKEVKKIKDDSINLILTDPPYNIARDNVFELEGRSNLSQDFGAWDKYTDQQFIDLFSTWTYEWARVLRDQGSGYVFTSDSYISHLRSALTTAGLHVKATIIWHKSNPGTQVVKTNFKSSVEYILFFTKGEGGHTFNWQGENEMHNFIETPICAGKERLVDGKGDTLHPTQKPERLLKHFTEISSNRGDMVFDGFMGVGSTGAVAKSLGRKFIGIEQDKVHFEAAQRRLAE